MIAGVVLAAGRSTRMGRFKPLLPWGRHTVIEQVATTMLAGPLDELLVVAGHEHEALAAVLRSYPARVIFNPDYATGEMISSIQAGLRALGPDVEAALMAVGDQPRLQAATLAAVTAAWRASSPPRIIIPSYRMRRGHPICLPRAVWPDVLALNWQEGLRSLWSKLAGQIEHLTLDSPTILSDMDTPDDYWREVNANTTDGHDLSPTERPVEPG